MESKAADWADPLTYEPFIVLNIAECVTGHVKDTDELIG